ncbi:hypothetical protein B7486_14690 [cyanobacterium TDX16]|nr:hypothetical protein B7486_14690 [cyanobacterium TDX16]
MAVAGWSDGCFARKTWRGWWSIAKRQAASGPIAVLGCGLVDDIAIETLAQRSRGLILGMWSVGG